MPERASSLAQTRASSAWAAAGLAAFLLVILVPFWWIANMSFKTYEQIQFATSIYVPRPWTWENYLGLWTGTRFPLWLRNSVVTAVVVTALTTVVTSVTTTAVITLLRSHSGNRVSVHSPV